MSKDNGGPAFPTIRDPSTHSNGMDLRDWFAATATEEDIQYQVCAMAPRNGFGEVMHRKVSRVSARYAHADAMLKERAKASQAES